MEAEAQQARQDDRDYYDLKLEWAEILVLGYWVAAGIALIFLCIGLVKLYKWAKSVEKTE